MFTGLASVTTNNNPAKFTVADISDYTDEPKEGFIGRRIWLYKANGTTLALPFQPNVVAGAKAIATLQFPAVPPDGNNIIIITSADLGSVVLGKYIVDNALDTSPSVLAANVAQSCNTAATAAGATASLSVSTSLPTDGQSITIALPEILGGVVLGSYTKQSTDTTREILITSIVAALTMPTGWTKTGLATTIVFNAPATDGAFPNGNPLTITTNFSVPPTGGTFTAGVTGHTPSTDYVITADGDIVSIERDSESPLPNGQVLVLDSYDAPEIKGEVVFTPPNMGLGSHSEAHIDILSVPANGANINVHTSVAMGSVLLGSYTKQPSDFSVAILAASVAAALAGTNYVIGSAAARVIVRYGLGSIAFNGESLVLSFNSAAEVRATANMSVTSFLSYPTGEFFTIQAYQPNFTWVTLGTYTKQADDTTAAIMGPRLATACSGNAYSYSVSYGGGFLTGQAPVGTGETMNGHYFYAFHDPAPPIASIFSGGVTAAAIIPNTNTAFASGTDLAMTIAVNDPVLGYVPLGTYTTQITDFYLGALYANHLIAAITGNTFGYTPTLTQLYKIKAKARTGIGASINGQSLTVIMPSDSFNEYFAGGLDPIGLIPNTKTPFAGGVAPVDEQVSLAYIDFPFEIGDEIEIDILDKDYVLSVFVEWLKASPESESTYTSRVVYAFTKYTEQFIYYIIQIIAGRPVILNDTTFATSLSKLQTWLDSAIRAALYRDVHSGQAALDRAKFLMDNKNMYF